MNAEPKLQRDLQNECHLLNLRLCESKELKAPGIVILVDDPLVGWIVGNTVFYGVVFDNACRTSKKGYDTMHMALAVE